MSGREEAGFVYEVGPTAIGPATLLAEIAPAIWFTTTPKTTSPA